jgi:hypothetical protein
MTKKRSTGRGAPAPLSLRLEPDLFERIKEVQDLYITSMNLPGFSAGPVKSVTRAEIVRWAIEEGLASIKQRLSKKGGQR